MRKLFILLLSASLMLFVGSCSQDFVGDTIDRPHEEATLVPLTITVGGDQTRTYIGDDGKTINWCADDTIAVFDGTGKREFTVVEGSVDGKFATFVGEVDASATEFYAVYPFSAAESMEDGLITLCAASEQRITEHNVADGAIISVGKFSISDTSFTFRNAMGFFRVDISAEDITAIVIDGCAVAGRVAVNGDGEIEEVVEAGNSVALYPNGDYFVPGSYYVTLLPGTTPADDFFITLEREAVMQMVMSSNKDVTIERNDGFFVRDTKFVEKFVIRDEESLKSFLALAPTMGAESVVEVVRNVELSGEALTAATTFAGTLEGNGHVIKGVTLADDATALFANLEGATIRNLVIDGATIATTKERAAVLFASAKGVTIENVSLNNCSVLGGNNVALLGGELSAGVNTISGVSTKSGSITAGGNHCGALVGYIGSGDNLGVETTISNCSVEAQFSTASHDGNSYGKLVGALKGYDNKDVLNIEQCSAAIAVADGSSFTSYYSNDFRSAFVAELVEGNEHLLGRHDYFRGVVTIDNELFVPKWDGVSVVEPLGSDVWSAYDLAYHQGKSLSALTFKQSVDLGHYLFTPLKSVATLDGGGFTLYNLAVNTIFDGQGSAFIQSTSGTTVHKNLTFEGADIKCYHDATIPNPVYGDTNDGNSGNAFAGTLVARASGTYTVENVHAKSGSVYGVCKIGGLIGANFANNFTMTNSSVDGYSVSNYDPLVPNYYCVPQTSVSLSFLGTGIVHGMQWWYTAGECGGLIGILISKQATISGCSVTNTDVNCIGQPNKEVVANVYKSSNFNANDPYRNGVELIAKGMTVIAGRHSNQFIGDIVSQRTSASSSDYTVSITDYTVLGNSYGGVSAESDDGHNHQYQTNKYCDIVGCLYYVGVDVNVIIISKHVYHYAGQLTFQPKGGGSVTITEASGKGSEKSWTGGDFSMSGLGGSSEYPAAPSTL